MRALLVRASAVMLGASIALGASWVTTTVTRNSARIARLEQRADHAAREREALKAQVRGLGQVPVTVLVLPPTTTVTTLTAVKVSRTTTTVRRRLTPTTRRPSTTQDRPSTTGHPTTTTTTCATPLIDGVCVQ